MLLSRLPKSSRLRKSIIYMYLIYNIAFAFLLIVASPYILTMALLGKKIMRERLGLLSPHKLAGLADRETIWLHAASVGEVTAGASVLREIKRARPGSAIVVSTITSTGLERAKQILKGVDLFLIVPLDFSPIVRHVLGKIEPRVLLLVEAEIWPNLISVARSRGCHIGLVSGKMSPKGFSYRRLAGALFSRTLELIDLLCLQSSEDEERFVQLGAKREQVEVTGNLKLDALEVGSDEADRRKLRQDLGISDEQKMVVAGSTRDGEEEILLRVFEELRRRFGDLVFVLAPRHLKRVEEIERIIKERGFSSIRKSEINTTGRTEELIILDTLGELSSIYAAADVAFVGGSLRPFGGHNPLEPAARGVTVIFGPYMEKGSAELLLKRGAAFRVKDENELSRRIAWLLENPAERRSRGEAGRTALQSGRGGARRTVELLIKRGII